MRLFRKHINGLRIVLLGILSGLLCVAFMTGCTEQPPIQDPANTVILPTGGAEGTAGGDAAAPTVPENQEIRFTDINFENAVREVLGKKLGSIYVADVQKLTSFSARVCGITNIQEIVYFTNLETLDLKGNRIVDLTPIGQLHQLKSLDISKNFNMLHGDKEKGLDLSPLRTLVLLETLNASGNMITDITPLAGLACLRSLDLQSNRLTDIEPLASCTGLESLNLASNYNFSSTNMQEQGIQSITAVAAMPNLKTLTVSNNILTSLEGVAALEHLEYLDVSQNYLMTLAPLADIPTLKTVIAQNNQLLDLSDLAGNTSIEVLDVRVNRIHYVPEILTMTALQTFQYEGNQILDYQPIDQFEKEVAAREDD